MQSVIQSKVNTGKFERGAQFTRVSKASRTRLGASRIKYWMRLRQNPVLRNTDAGRNLIAVGECERIMAVVGVVKKLW